MGDKYIFMDFDGTISDSKKLEYGVLIDVFDRMDFAFSRVLVRKAMGGKVHEILKSLGVDEKLAMEVKKRFYSEIMKGVNLKNLKLCCNLKPLWELKDLGYKIIIVSNGAKRFLDASIKALGLGELFFEVHGADEFDTKDVFLRKIAKRYRIGKGVYVGDRFSDVTYANRAGFISIAIYNKCSWSTKKEILTENPDYIIHDFKDLKEIVLKLKKN